MEECRKLIPCFDPAEIIHSFAGVRAKNSTGDWVVRPAKGQPSFVHAAGYVCVLLQCILVVLELSAHFYVETAVVLERHKSRTDE